MKQTNKLVAGFTLIELVVAIAIVGILASIVLINVQQYVEKAKVTRAVVDSQNIGKALQAFHTQYDDYPWGLTPGYANTGEADFSGPDVSIVNNNEPFLTDGAGTHYLSEFYNSNYNADYFLQGAYYNVSLYLGDTDPTKIGCGLVTLTNGIDTYGWKYIICQDCQDCCDGSCDSNGDGNYNTPFSLTPIPLQ